MEMLPETCGVSNSGSKRHMNLVSQEKGRKEQNRTEQDGCSTSAFKQMLHVAMIQLSLRLLAFAAAGDCAR
jgi:hypothetical protein